MGVYLEDLKYCKRCEVLTIEKRCHNCGTKKLKEPMANDIVYFSTESNYTYKILLKRNGIPCAVKELGIASPASGRAGSPYAFYVFFSDFNKARELVGASVIKTRLSKAKENTHKICECSKKFKKCCRNLSS